MIKDTEKLEQLGFTDYESKVFLALYKGSVMSAAEAAKEAKIPRPSVYEILKNFAKKGICNEIKTPSKLIYEIIDSSVLENKIENEIRKDYMLKLARLKATFKEIKPLFRSKPSKDFKSNVELIKGFNRSRETKFLELIKHSKNAILFMNRFEGNISDELDNESKSFLKRGGKIRSIYEAKGNFKIKIYNTWKVVSKAQLIKLCRKFEKQGEQIKLTDNVPQIIAVFDAKTVYISLFEEQISKSDSIDMIIHNKRFAAFVTEMFEIYWDKSHSIEKFAKTIFKSNNLI